MTLPGTSHTACSFLLQTVILKEEVFYKTQLATIKINRPIWNNDRLKCHFVFILMSLQLPVSPEKFKQDATTHLN